MRYRIQNLGTGLKDTKRRLYGTNFLEFKIKKLSKNNS